MNYSALGHKAALLLTKHGLPVTLTRGASTIANTVGAFVKSRAEDDRSVPSSIMASTTMTRRALLISGLSTPPQVGDLVTADGIDYIIGAVETIRPATITVLYKVELS